MSGSGDVVEIWCQLCSAAHPSCEEEYRASPLYDGIWGSISDARIAAEAEGFESTGDRREMVRGDVSIEIVEWQGSYAWSVVR